MQSYRDRSLGAVLARLGIAAVALSCHAQALAAPFQNLDFESATIGTIVNGYELPTSQALPYWTNDNWDAGYVGYDGCSLASTMVSIQDGLNPYQQGSVWMYPLQGYYSVFLQGSYVPKGAPWTSRDAWISQTGDVPSDARSLMFETDFAPDATFAVSLNGTPIPMSLYSLGPVINPNFGPVETYIGDISAFAGQQAVTLRFEPVSTDGLSAQADLDAIQFSTIVVPEPSALMLIVAGVLSLAGYFWRRRSGASQLR